MLLARSVRTRIWSWKNSDEDLERVLHVLSLVQLVTEVKRRGDVALHEIAELLGLVGDRQRRGAQTFSSRSKYSSLDRTSFPVTR